MEQPLDSTSAAPPTGLAAILRTEVLASMIVFLVALPLCLGIAKACGAPPALGLITGIVGGIIVGSFAGSPLQVSGPAAGLIVLVAGIVTQFKDPARPGREFTALGLVVLIGGAIQIAAGLGRLGQWFRAVSPAVIEGMLAGIGVLIIVSQFHIMVDDASRGSGLKDIGALPESIAKAITPPPGTFHHYAAGLGLLTIGILVLWKAFAPKKLQLIPGPLIAVIACVASASALGWNVPDVEGKTIIKVVDLPASLWDAVTLPSALTLDLLRDPAIWKAGMTIALVASAETLLCATAVDQMHRGPRTQYNRELGAQGIGNTICGVLGALPMTGVIVRSAANVEAGARTRWSAVLHGFWLLLFVLLLPGVLKLIPTSCLAGILIFTGYRLVNIGHAKKLFHESRGEFAIYLITLVTIVLVDLLTGVITGIVLSAMKLLFAFSHLDIEREDAGDNAVELKLRGAATFIRLPILAQTLASIPPNTELRVDFDELAYIDHACLELLLNWEKQHAATGGTLAIDWGKLRAKFQKAKASNSGILRQQRKREGA